MSCPAVGDGKTRRSRRLARRERRTAWPRRNLARRILDVGGRFPMEGREIILVRRLGNLVDEEPVPVGGQVSKYHPVVKAYIADPHRHLVSRDHLGRRGSDPAGRRTRHRDGTLRCCGRKSRRPSPTRITTGPSAGGTWPLGWMPTMRYPDPGAAAGCGWPSPLSIGALDTPVASAAVAPGAGSPHPSQSACAAFRQPVCRYSPERCCLTVVSLMPSS